MSQQSSRFLAFGGALAGAFFAGRWLTLTPWAARRNNELIHGDGRHG